MIGTDLSIIAPVETAKVARGLVFGKFMPPTLGHQYLCDAARTSCDQLTIIVGTLPDEPIPGDLRYQWMKEMFPSCRVLHLDKVMPQAPAHAEDRAFFKLWADTLHETSGTRFDALFASESYGYKVAEAMGTRFIPVDTARQAVRICATDIRNNPFSHWDKLPAVVRPYFTKNVRLTGGSLDERRSMAAALAETFRTVYADDAACILLDDFRKNLPDYPDALREMDRITAQRAQKAAESALAKQARGILLLVGEGSGQDVLIDVTTETAASAAALLQKLYPGL